MTPLLEMEEYIREILNSRLQKYDQIKGTPVVTDDSALTGEPPNVIRVRLGSQEYEKISMNNFLGTYYSRLGLVLDKNYKPTSIWSFMVESDMSALTLSEGYLVFKFTTKTNLHKEFRKYTNVPFTPDNTLTYTFPVADVDVKSVRVSIESRYLEEGPDITVLADRIDFHADFENVEVQIQYFNKDSESDHVVADNQVYDSLVGGVHFKMGRIVKGDKYIFRIADDPMLGYNVKGGLSNAPIEIEVQASSQPFARFLGDVVYSELIDMIDILGEFNITVDDISVGEMEDEEVSEGQARYNRSITFTITYNVQKYIPVNFAYFILYTGELEVKLEPVEVVHATSLYGAYFK